MKPKLAPLMTSNSEEWSTPQDLFDELNAKFSFTLDAAASDENHKCKKYFTKADDGLIQSWKGHRTFLNPPYGRQIGDWMKKCREEQFNHGVFTVALLPARTDTRWFHAWCKHDDVHIEFIHGRLKFGGSKNSAPFPSMLVYFL